MKIGSIFVINKWKNIKCSSFNKIPGNTFTVSHNTLIRPIQQLYAYCTVSTGSEQPLHLPQWKAFESLDIQFPDKLETIIA